MMYDSNRVTFEEPNLVRAIRDFEARLLHINRSLRAGKLRGTAAEYVSRERESIEWLLPRLRAIQREQAARPPGAENGRPGATR